MTTHDALLAAVIAAPDDDLPRLVYADHLPRMVNRRNDDRRIMQFGTPRSSGEADRGESR